jgi:hypothetical protein
MEHAIRIEMFANSICVEGNEKDVLHLPRNQLQACIQCAAANGFT